MPSKPLSCPECGATSRLGADGRCTWRAGCEHRQLQARAWGERLAAELTDERLPCGHTQAEHDAMRQRLGIAGMPMTFDPAALLTPQEAIERAFEWMRRVAFNRAEFEGNWADAEEVDGDGYTRGGFPLGWDDDDPEDDAP